MSEGQIHTTLDGCDIAFDLHCVNPDFPTVVLSGSLGTIYEMWDPQLESLKLHFNVLRYDSRGHGRSSVFPGAYSIDRLGLDVIDLIDSLDLKQIHFCGLSIGGMVGQWLACRHPERIHKLVLANTSAYIGPPAFWQARIDAITKNGMADFWEGIQARWFTPDFILAEPQLMAQLKAMFTSIDPAGYTGCCAAIRDMDLRGIASSNQLPTLIIAGTEDLATPVAQSEYLLEQSANSQLLKVFAGHLSNLEAQSEFTDRTVEFLLN